MQRKRRGVRGEEVLKWMSENKRRMVVAALFLVIYIVVSMGLLGFGEREVQRGIHKMWIPCTTPSDTLQTEADYRQGFFTPSDVTGIELYLVVPETKEYADMILRVYDWMSGELVGESEITPERIEDDGKVSVIFEDYVLREGKAYAFEVSTVSDKSIPTQIWTGETQQGYGMNVLYQGAELEGTSLVYNLLYDYEDGHLVLWIFLTVVFLAVFLKITGVGMGKVQDVVVWCVIYITIFILTYGFKKMG